MNDKKLEFTLSGNQEFMKLIESDDTSTTEMLDRLFIAEEAICDVGRAVLRLTETLDEKKCPFNDIALDALKLSLNQLYWDVTLRIELIYSKDSSVFNRMTFAKQHSDEIVSSEETQSSE